MYPWTKKSPSNFRSHPDPESRFGSGHRIGIRIGVQTRVALAEICALRLFTATNFYVAAAEMELDRSHIEKVRQHYYQAAARVNSSESARYATTGEHTKEK